MIRAVLALLIFLLLLPSGAHAATWYVKTTGASTTGPADSCKNESGATHVQAAFDAAASGDTVEMAAGTCTWTVVPDFTTSPKSITLRGQGASSTTIDDGLTSGGWTWAIPSGGYGRLTKVKLTHSVLHTQSFLSINGTASESEPAGPRFRMDNTDWSNWTNISGATSIVTSRNVRLLVVGNTKTGVFREWWQHNYPAWKGLGTIGNEAWKNPSTFATDQAGYFEDNTISTSSTSTPTHIEGDSGGGKLVCRYNTSDNGVLCSGHGAGTGAHRGHRHNEVYGNSIASSATNSPAYVQQVRSGTALSWGNTLATASATWNTGVRMWAERYNDGVGGFASCDGSGVKSANGGNCWDCNTAGSCSTAAADVFTGTITTGGTDSATDTGKNFETACSGGSCVGYVIYNSGAATKWSSMIISATGSSFTTEPKASGGPNHTFTVGDAYAVRQIGLVVDQPGYGAGTFPADSSTSTTAPTSPVGNDQGIEPVYVWGWTGTNVTTYVNHKPNAGWAKNGRDYFNDRGGTFDCVFSVGTSEATIGTGTAAQKDGFTGCTEGAGFWVTNEGNWNLTLAANASGKLYKYTGGAWTSWYGSNCTGGSPTCDTAGEPYQYPHKWNYDPTLSDTATTSAVVTNNSSVLADGVATATITVTLTTDTGKVARGKTIALSDGACTSTITTSPATTDTSGQASFTVKNSTAEACTYTATCTTCNGTDDLTITSTAAVTFTAAASDNTPRLSPRWLRRR